MHRPQIPNYIPAQTHTNGVEPITIPANFQFDGQRKHQKIHPKLQIIDLARLIYESSNNYILPNPSCIQKAKEDITSKNWQLKHLSKIRSN